MEVYKSKCCKDMDASQCVIELLCTTQTILTKYWNYISHIYSRRNYYENTFFVIFRKSKLEKNNRKWGHALKVLKRFIDNFIHIRPENELLSGNEIESLDMALKHLTRTYIDGVNVRNKNV